MRRWGGADKILPMTSTALARAVVQALLDGGVRHVVLCPGSRNAPLGFALDAAARAGALALHTRIDERTAGFLALGIAKSSRRPVAVVTTSGTAVANLHPAVLEAAHAGVPLVVVSADRPASLRGTGANQTTEQVGMYGAAAPTVDIDREVPALEADGPVHWNVQLSEPLVPEDAWTPTAPDPDHGRSRWTRPKVATRLVQGPRTVVVAGDDSGNEARLLAEQGRWPLLAEPSSGSRNGRNPIRTYRLLLGTGLGEQIERVVVVGHPTLSRPVMRLLQREDVEVLSVRTRGRWADRPFRCTEHPGFVVAEPDDGSWLAQWQQADERLGREIDDLLAREDGLTPHEVAAAVHAAVPPQGLLFVGASNPIRDLDLMAGAYRVGERRLVIANRGLAGIDGTVSSAIGAVLGRPHTSRALLYVGDVTFLHDLNGLLVGPGESRPDLTVVVANDDGGSIFATLEQGDPAFADSYEKLFGTPHGVDLASVCAGLRVPHWRVDSRSELEHALANPNGGIDVVEAVIRRDNRRELDAAIRGLAR